MMFKFLLLSLSIALISAPKTLAAPDDTPDWWNCPNRTSGEWKFGLAPDVCDMDSFIDLDYVDNEFGEFIYEDTAPRESERERYMAETYALIKDVADYYFHKRKPNASIEEIEIFLRASLTIGHQESFWTHYRRPAHGTVQFMRSGGDYGHGHGIFQVDDRWHFPAVLDGRAANIVMNMVYSLEEYFHAWQTAPSTNCSSEEDYIARARSAYSAYNGGLKRICRWTNPNDRWARNDKGWWSKYNRKEWEVHVDDLDRNTNVDIDCIVQGNEGCRLDQDDDLEPVKGRVYKSSDSRYCAFNGSGFDCVESINDMSCLVLSKVDDFSNFRGRFRRMSSNFETDYSLENENRYSLCKNNTTDLYSIGDSTIVRKNINLRNTPAGAWKVTVPANTVVQVLDYVVKDVQSQKRYYKVKYKNHVGFIYSGDMGDSSAWAQLSSKVSPYRLIASVGDQIKVERENGVEVLNEVGEVTGRLSYSDKVKVLERVISIDTDSIFYKIGDNEFVVAGKKGQDLELKDIFSIFIKTDRAPKYMAKLRKSTWWKKLRACPSSKCKKSGSVKGPRLSKKSFYVIDQDGSWRLIEQGSKKGWLKSKYIRKL